MSSAERGHKACNSPQARGFGSPSLKGGLLDNHIAANALVLLECSLATVSIGMYVAALLHQTKGF